MRCCTSFSFVGALALILSAGAVRAENASAYDSWAKLKPGSSVTVKTISEASGQKTEMEMTYVLDSVTPEKAVVDVKTSMVVAGNKMDLPARKQDIPKVAAGGAAPTPAPSTPTPDIKQSEDTVKIGDKSYNCHVVEATSDNSGMKTTSKTWTCPEVPNMMVKMEASTTGTIASKTSMTVTKIDLK